MILITEFLIFLSCFIFWKVTLYISLHSDSCKLTELNDFLGILEYKIKMVTFFSF